MLLPAMVLLLGGCTSVSRLPPTALDDSGVNRCTIADHGRCIALTGQEVIEDGRSGTWSRHWFRMSYIGRACHEQYGTTVGVLVESVFAIPHYASIAVVNGAAAFIAPFRDQRKHYTERYRDVPGPGELPR
ncbi:MAG: hypothetical protein U5K73_02440 [Halofilum sp. (in: g-proteobacteria)]|nr:hypothetical protein [Halofilum sp. (in: g-proteobacteria)]